MRLGDICFQRGCQGQGPDKGLLWLWFPLPHCFPQGAMLGLPGPVFPLLPHSLHSSRSFSPGLVGGSTPPCAWPSFLLCSQVLAMGPRTPLAPVVPSNFCLALLVCPGPPFTSCISAAHEGLGPDRTMLNPEDWRPKARVKGISGEKSKWSILPTIPGRHLSTCSL